MYSWFTILCIDIYRVQIGKLKNRTISYLDWQNNKYIFKHKNLGTETNQNKK